MQEQKLILSNNLLGLRLDKVLTILISGLSLRSARRLCDNGQVFSEYKGQEIRQNSAYKAKKACIIHIRSNMQVEENPPKAYLIQKDTDFAVVYKPAKLHSVEIKEQNNQSLQALLPSLLPLEQDIFMLSRLDFDTSGLVALALNQKAEAAWKKAQNSALITKKYLAIVEGQAEDLVLDFELDTSKKQKVFVTQNKQSEDCRQTIIKKIANLSACQLEAASLDKASEEGLGFLGSALGQDLSLVQASIFQGVRHQIRANLAYIGNPLLYDSLYGSKYKDGSFYLQNYEIKSPFFNLRHIADWTQSVVTYL